MLIWEFSETFKRAVFGSNSRKIYEAIYQQPRDFRQQSCCFNEIDFNIDLFWTHSQLFENTLRKHFSQSLFLLRSEVLECTSVTIETKGLFWNFVNFNLSFPSVPQKYLPWSFQFTTYVVLDIFQNSWCRNFIEVPLKNICNGLFQSSAIQFSTKRNFLKFSKLSLSP